MLGLSFLTIGPAGLLFSFFGLTIVMYFIRRTPLIILALLVALGAVAYTENGKEIPSLFQE